MHIYSRRTATPEESNKWLLGINSLMASIIWPAVLNNSIKNLKSGCKVEIINRESCMFSSALNTNIYDINLTRTAKILYNNGNDFNRCKKTGKRKGYTRIKNKYWEANCGYYYFYIILSILLIYFQTTWAIKNCQAILKDIENKKTAGLNTTA